MKTVLRISILLNSALLGWLIMTRSSAVKPAPQPAARNAVSAVPSVAAVPAPPAPAASATPEPFRWEQLYAKDYHVYVKNLRALECPEATVRAIVAADVHAVLQPRADELEKKLSDLANSSWSTQLGSWNSEQAWKAELLHLPDEEAAMLADCLGERTTAPSPAPARSNHHSGVEVAPAPIVVPLVDQPVNLAALNLDQGQLQAIADLQNVFLQKIGGPNQDPNDPAYQARWRTAQAEVDNLMQGMIGDQAYQDYQLQAFARSQAKLADAAQPADSSLSP